MLQPPQGVDAPEMLALIQRELRQLDSQLPILTARLMTTHRDASPSQWAVRAAAALFTTFAALALLLATIGAYGLTAYDVAGRTREIGIRMALGANTSDVTRMVLRDGYRATAVGLAIGVVLAFATGRLVSSLLYQVSPFDPIAIGVAIMALAAATFVAGYVPARRAARIAPLAALRTE
jgi:ABC-type antimicrobial peptide transport system permease subunit